MTMDKAQKEFEKQIRKEWNKKLKKEGFEPAGSAGNDPDNPKSQYLSELMTRVMKEYNPIEMRVIHESVFDSRYIGAPTYRIYIRK